MNTPDPVSRAAFVATVESYVGTPYVHQGLVPGPTGGMDCPAPIILAARAHGIVPEGFDVTGYSREPDGIQLQAWCERYMLPVPEGVPLQAGDVLLCAFAQHAPRHLGVLVDPTPNRMYWVHAEGWAHKSVMRSRLLFGTRGLRRVAAYAVPGVA